MNSPVVIELVDLAIAAVDGGGMVLEQVTWSVAEGDFWIVAGAHGSGKSALLATLAGLMPFARGELRVFGDAVPTEGKQAVPWRRRVGLVFEAGGRPLRDLTVAENIALPLCYHEDIAPSMAVERIAPLIAALELDRLAAVSSGRIGRAWSQRVALARALVLSPEVLLLDNPLAGLDPYHLRWWRSFLPQLNAGHPACGGRPVTLVVTTDDLQPWLSLGRQFAQIERGQWRVFLDSAQFESELSETSQVH